MSAFSPRQGAKAPREVRNPIASLAAESKADVRWLESRLMPGGPSLIIDTLREAAKNGDVDKLRTTMEKAREHGESFIQSLDTIPMEPDMEIRPVSVKAVSFMGGPKSTDPKSSEAVSPSVRIGIWTWAENHLKNLQRAECEFQNLIKEARSAAIAAETFSLPSSERNPLMRRTAVTENVNGASATKITQSRPSFGKSWTEPAVSGRTGQDDDSSECFSKCMSAASQRWQSVGINVSSTDNTKQGGTRTALRVAELVGVACFVRAQEQLLAAESNLRKRLALADTLRGMSRTRSVLYSEALQAIDGLKDCQAQLFHRLQLWLMPVEDELKLQTRGSSSQALERAIVKIRALVGTPSLIGASGVAAAEALCPLEDRADAPDDIWAGLALRVPPWEASFTAACRRLSQLRAFERERALRLTQPTPTQRAEPTGDTEAR